MAKIIDCFLFNGEADALEIRLKELNPVVDYFILIEGNKTFSGRKKEFKYINHWRILKPYAKKLIIHHCSQWPKVKDAWGREIYQRNSIKNATSFADDSDWILISDVDEIPSRNKIKNLSSLMSNISLVGFILKFRYFFVNYENTVGPESKLAWNFAIRKKNMGDKDLHTIRRGFTQIQACAILCTLKQVGTFLTLATRKVLYQRLKISLIKNSTTTNSLAQ